MPARHDKSDLDRKASEQKPAHVVLGRTECRRVRVSVHDPVA